MLLILLLAGMVARALPVEVAIQVGHTRNQWIRDVAFLPSGRHVITAGSGVFLWEVQSGRQLRAFRGQAADVATIAVSPDGLWLATGSFDKTIRLHEIETGRLMASKAVEGGLQSLAFSPDGRSLAATYYNNTGNSRGGVTLFTREGGQLGSSREIHCLYGVERASFSPDGARLVCASKYEAQIVTVAGGKKAGESFKQRAGAFHPLKPDLYALAEAGKVHLRNLETGADRVVADAPFVSDGPAISYSSDGRRLLVAYQVLDTDTWQKLMSAGDGRAGALSPDGKTVAAMEGNSGGLHDIATGKLIRAFDSAVASINGVATSADGRYLITAGATARLWDLSRGRPVRNLGGGAIEKAAFFDGSQQVVLLTSDKQLQFCDVDSDKIRMLPLKDVSHFALDAKGKVLALANGDEVWLITVPAGKALRRFPAGSPSSLALSPSGKNIVTGHENGTAVVWNARGEQLGKVQEGESTKTVRSLAFSHSGTILATGHGSGNILLWSFPELQLIKTLATDGKDLFAWPTALTFSADDATLAASHEDTWIRLWDVSSGAPSKALRGHDYAATGVSYQSPKRLVTSSEDRTVKLWNTDTGEVVATLLSMQKDGYAIYTPDNYYTASRGTSDSISFLRGLEVYPFDSFDLIFNRPDILVDRLGIAPRAMVDAYKAAYTKRIQLMGFTEATLSADMHLPQAHFTGSKPTLEMPTRKLSLAVAASDSKYQLARINLWVNGVPTLTQAGFSLVDQKTKRIEKTFQVELSTGSNFIEVSAHNEKGIESPREELEVRYLGPSSPPTTWVVAFGVSSYADHDYDLHYAAKDAADVARTLREVRKGTQAKVFSDAQVTRESLADARAFLERSGVDDTVVVFVAGHGLLGDDFGYYFASSDTDFAKPEKRAIAYEKLDGLLDGLKARRKLLLIDTCNSGEVDKAAMMPIKTAEGSIVPHGSRGIKAKYKLSLGETQALLTELFADLRRGTGAVVISSAGGAEYALESDEWKNGVFTFALIEALHLLRGADTNQDNQLQVSELREHVSSRVTELTRGAQKPTVRRDNLYVDFPLAGQAP